MRSNRHLLLGLATAWTAIYASSVPAADPGLPGTSPRIVAAAEKEGRLVIYSTTDSAAVQPLLAEFATLYPRVSVQYQELASSELHDRFTREVATGQRSADLLWSSAMDLQNRSAER
jgi:iron(III) transport system substrate-binding protein